MGYLFLLLSKMSAGAKMIAVKNCGSIAKGTRNSVIVNVIRSLGCVLVSLCVCLISGFGGMDLPGVLISILAGISNGLSLCTWILCASAVSLCTVEVFCMAGGVVLPLLVSPLIFKGDEVSLPQWIGSALLFVAMYLLSNNKGKTKMSVSKILLLTLCGAANFGCVLSKKLFINLSSGSLETFQLLTFVFVFLTLFIILLFIPKDSKNPAPSFTSKVSLYIFIAIVMLYLTEYLATRSAGYLSSSVYYPLSYVISMPMTFLIDVVVYKEKITVYNVIGIVVVTASGVLVNL